MSKTFQIKQPGIGGVDVVWKGDELSKLSKKVLEKGIAEMLDVSVSKAESVATGKWKSTIEWKKFSRGSNLTGKVKYTYGSTAKYAFFAEHGRPGTTAKARGKAKGQHALYKGYDAGAKKLPSILRNKI